MAGSGRPEPPLRALWLIACVVCALLSVAAGERPAMAAEEGVAPSRSVVVPGFWDPRRRPERPDLSRIQTIRFLTDLDYPPFDYAGPDGNPAGFNVDLARRICDEIKVSCTIQARPFDTLLDALNDNRGDAVIASIAPTAETRRRADFSDPYYRTPARFVARADSPLGDVLPERLEGMKIAVIAGTAHEAFLKEMFTEAEIRPYPNAEAARDACCARTSTFCSATASRWRSGSTAPIRAAAAPSAAGRSSRAAISAKASASRSSAATICCARP